MTTTKKRKASAQARILAGLLITGGGTGIIANYWRHATSNFSDLDCSKPASVALKTSDDPDYLAIRTHQVKERFTDMIASAGHQDSTDQLSASEKAIVGDTLAQYEFLEEVRKSSGLYAAAFRKKDSGEIVLTYGGTSHRSGIGPVINNIDDMFISTSGGKISQLDDALAFAEHVKKTYGAIDYVSGYSIGGYLALYLLGSGQAGNAECYVFDAPGVSKAMLKQCCKLSGENEAAVAERFQNQCTSVSVSRNTYNTLGEQAGEYLTFSNDLCNWSIIPKDHLYPAFTSGVAKGKQLVNGDNKDYSNGPAVCTTALTALAALGLALALKKEKPAEKGKASLIEIIPPLSKPERTRAGVAPGL